MADLGKARFPLDDRSRMCNLLYELLNPVQLLRGFDEDISLQFVGNNDSGDFDIGRLGLNRLEDIVGNRPFLLGCCFYRKDTVDEDLGAGRDLGRCGRGGSWFGQAPQFGSTPKNS